MQRVSTIGRTRAAAGKVALTCAGVFMSASIANSAQAACWQPHEVAAAEVRYFQSMLMVGALQCRDENRFIEEDYNRFVTQSRAVLDENNTTIRTRFTRDYGMRDGEYLYDRFTTRIANDFASQTDHAAFCQDAAGLARIAADSHPYDMIVLARSVVGSLPLRDPVCDRDDWNGGVYARDDAPRGRDDWREEDWREDAVRPAVDDNVDAARPRGGLALPSPPMTTRGETATRPSRSRAAVAPPARVETADAADTAADLARREAAMTAALQALEAATAALRAAQPVRPATADDLDRSEESDRGSDDARYRDSVIVDGVPTDERPLIPTRE